MDVGNECEERVSSKAGKQYSVKAALDYVLTDLFASMD